LSILFHCSISSFHKQSIFAQFPFSLIAEEQIEGQPWSLQMCGILAPRPMDLVLTPFVCGNSHESGSMVSCCGHGFHSNAMEIGFNKYR
jgi:hypothetical protein